METQAMVIYGNPVDGFQYVGPFSDGESAEQWIHNNLKNENWWIASLMPAGDSVPNSVRTGKWTKY